jgi:uncharacterized protein (DUF433 family)
MVAPQNETHMATHPRISRDPNIVFGKPAINGTRISVEFILERLAASWSEAEILENYPHITRNDILACIAYPHDLVQETSSITRAAE